MGTTRSFSWMKAIPDISIRECYRADIMSETLNKTWRLELAVKCLSCRVHDFLIVTFLRNWFLCPRVQRLLRPLASISSQWAVTIKGRNPKRYSNFRMADNVHVHYPYGKAQRWKQNYLPQLLSWRIWRINKPVKVTENRKTGRRTVQLPTKKRH